MITWRTAAYNILFLECRKKLHMLRRPRGRKQSMRKLLKHMRSRSLYIIFSFPFESILIPNCVEFLQISNSASCSVISCFVESQWWQWGIWKIHFWDPRWCWAGSQLLGMTSINIITVLHSWLVSIIPFNLKFKLDLVNYCCCKRSSSSW